MILTSSRTLLFIMIAATIRGGLGLVRGSVANRVESAFIGGLIADSLSLERHYEYDAQKIKATGGCKDYSAPGESNNGIGWGQANYHPGKVAGDLTDAGEIAIMLLDHLVDLKSINSLSSYSFDTFAVAWRRNIEELGYGSCNFISVGRNVKVCPAGTRPGYINGGSRRTLQALGSVSSAPTGQARRDIAAEVNCLVAATHFLPLFLVLNEEEKLIHEAKDTIYVSHRHADPLAAAEFLSKTLFLMLHKDTPLEEALNTAAAASTHPLIPRWLSDARAKVAEARDPTSHLSQQGPLMDDIAITSMSRLWDIGKTEPIKIGKASPTEGALPSALYFVLKYIGNFEEALVSNAECGGDSAARGIVIGMLLEAHEGWVKKNEGHRWLTGLNELERVKRQMKLLREDRGDGVEEEL